MQKKIDRGKVAIAIIIDKIVRIHPQIPIPVSDESAEKGQKRNIQLSLKKHKYKKKFFSFVL